jgi:hypothetical protein
VGHRAQLLLIATEVALALVLLISAGLVGRSLVEVFRVDPGFVADDMATVQLNLPARISSNAEAASFVARLAENVSGVPGVESVSGSSALPFSGRIHSSSCEIEGRPVEPNGKHPESRVVVADHVTSRRTANLAQNIKRDRSEILARDLQDHHRAVVR